MERRSLLLTRRRLLTRRPWARTMAPSVARRKAYGAPRRAVCPAERQAEKAREGHQLTWEQARQERQGSPDGAAEARASYHL